MSAMPVGKRLARKFGGMGGDNGRYFSTTKKGESEHPSHDHDLGSGVEVIVRY